VRRRPAAVSINVRRKSVLIARRVVHHCVSLQINTHSHQFLPFSRTEVSSEQTTGLASTTFSIAAVASSRGSRARARMLQIAPSLIDSENSSFSQRFGAVRLAPTKR
jgi:hypothetical protein